MGCNPNGVLKGMAVSCDDKPKGGLVQVYAARLADVTAALTGQSAAISAVVAGSVVEMQFNTKDGYSFAETQYTGEKDGTETFVPTVSLEAPKVTGTKLESVLSMTGGFNQIVVFVKQRTGIMAAYGLDNGVYVSSAKSATGTDADKNSLQYTFTGDEDSFEYEIDQASWDIVAAGVA